MNFKTTVFLLFIPIHFLCAQKTQIIGVGEDWKGREVRVLSDADPVSGTLNVLEKTTIDDSGKFSVTIGIENTQMVWLAVNRFKAPIYIRPSESYEVQIGGKDDNPFIDTWNKGELVYTFNYLPEGDPNKEIGAFDQAYYDLFLDNAELIGKSAMKEKVTAFEEKWADKYSAPYLRDYVKYSIAKMKLSSGFSKIDIYETYLTDEADAFSNTGFRDFFHTFYTDYFDQYHSRFKKVQIEKLLGKKPDVDAFFEHIEDDTFMTSTVIRQMVLLKAIDEVYGDSRYSKNALKQVLKRVETTSKTEATATIASNIRTKWEKDEGALTMEYIKKEFASNLEYQRSAENVFVITNAKSRVGEKELNLLADLSDTYSDYFRVTECTVGKSEEGQRKPIWPVAKADDAYGLLELLDVYSFPHFIWVDQKGVIVENGIERPSEGLERRLHQIKVRKEAKEKIKVGK